MGKKRRYLNRVKKFGNKMFRWLDSCDGTRDDQLLDSRIDTVISSLSIVDRGNQTFNFVATCTGPGGGANNLAGDRVYYLVDGTAVHSTQVPTMTDNGAGKKRKRWTCTGADPATFGGATDVLLTPGEHTLTAVIQTSVAGNAEISEAVTKKFTIARSEIVLGALDEAFTADNTNGQVDLDLSKITVSGKRPGEEDDYDPTNAGKDSFIITCKKSDGSAVTLNAGKTTLAENGGRTDADTDILDNAERPASGESETFTFTFTPRTAANANIDVDAKSVTLTVSRA